MKDIHMSMFYFLHWFYCLYREYLNISTSWQRQLNAIEAWFLTATNFIFVPLYVVILILVSVMHVSMMYVPNAVLCAQQYLTMAGGMLVVPLLISTSFCFRGDWVATAELLSTMFFVSGIATFVQCTVGCRLVFLRAEWRRPTLLQSICEWLKFYSNVASTVISFSRGGVRWGPTHVASQIAPTTPCWTGISAKSSGSAI